MILVTAVLSIGYGFIAKRRFTLSYIFYANFMLGAIIMSIAVVMMILPARLKLGKLTDHTTLAQRYTEQHAQKQEKAFEFLFLGLSVIIITGLIQLALAFLI